MDMPNEMNTEMFLLGLCLFRRNKSPLEIETVSFDFIRMAIASGEVVGCGDFGAHCE